MRYEISYGPEDKRNKWGYLIEVAPVYTRYADSDTEAKEIAMRISNQYKKWDVNIYDTQGPQDDPEDPRSAVWLISSYKKGTLVFENNEYYKALHINI